VLGVADGASVVSDASDALAPPPARLWSAGTHRPERAPSPGVAALAVRGVTKIFPAPNRLWAVARPRVSAPVLSDVTFSVGFGEIVGVMGPNGAGKTTLLEIVARLVEHTAGSIEVCGRDVVRHPAGARAMLGYSGAAGHGFYGRMSARRNLEFFAVLNDIPRREARGRAEAWLGLMGLEHAASARVETFSEGMLQRLALARALIADPAVLLLDEPTRSVDPAFRRTLHRLLRRWCDEGARRAILMVTHSADEVEAVCDRVCVLDRGRLAWEGSALGARATAALHAAPSPAIVTRA
jgi:ABC-2 type transport system ATP-binding protein